VPEQRQFDVAGLTLAAQVWGPAGGRPVLALHGWLDNASSFDLLAPRLPGCEIVALDLAGHGQSGSRSADAAYNIWQDVGELFDVLAGLGWQRCNLLGHSRGGAIAMLFAAAFPERVDKLVLLEGGVPLIGDPADAPVDLARAIVDARNLYGKNGRVFTDRAKAVAERAQGFTKISLAAAEILARRSLRSVPGGFQWHADQRLKGASELRLSRDHVRAFARSVRAPVLLVLADDGPFGKTPHYLELLELLPNVEVLRLPGGHHLHLEGAEAEIAERILRFFGS
jgi:pimeloyl-ACP methyl ester carboxylesterase